MLLVLLSTLTALGVLSGEIPENTDGDDSLNGPDGTGPLPDLDDEDQQNLVGLDGDFFSNWPDEDPTSTPTQNDANLDIVPDDNWLLEAAEFAPEQPIPADAKIAQTSEDTDAQHSVQQDRDTLLFAESRSLLRGGFGNGTINSHSEDDSLFSDSDSYDPNAGYLLYGGGSADVFVAGQHSVIADFTPGEDELLFLFDGPALPATIEFDFLSVPVFDGANYMGHDLHMHVSSPGGELDQTVVLKRLGIVPPGGDVSQAHPLPEANQASFTSAASFLSRADTETDVIASHDEDELFPPV